MVVAVDVNYVNETLAAAAAVVFDHFTDTTPAAWYTARITDFGPYIPGKFYLRELPCITAVLEKVIENLDIVIIDGYVMLGVGRPGLGCHLYRHLGRRTAVIGAAKSLFPGSAPAKVFRGQSRRPLYITALGMDQNIAAEQIIRMAGDSRIPDHLRLADRLAKAAAAIAPTRRTGRSTH